MKQDKIYFKGLDTLRAIGAISVVLCHVELSKKSLLLPNIVDSIPFFKYTSGHLGVMLFFVISGFLLTFLLIKEKELTSSICLKDFYIRRFLRIMPIYYLIVILLIFVLPIVVNLEYFGKPNLSNWEVLLPTVLIYLFLAPNFMVFGINGLGGGYQLGSIGTEEQFYLIWPLIILKFKNIFIIFLFIFITISLAPHFCDYISSNFFTNRDKAYLFLKKLSEFFMYFKINCMALGGIFAYIYYYNKKIITFFYHPVCQFFSIGFGFTGWLLGVHFAYFTDEIYAVCFALIIINVATNPKTIISLESRLTNYLGRISYGIYVYHWAIIYIMMEIMQNLNLSILSYNIFLYLGTFGFTIIISHLSYFYFEKKFLKLKEKYSNI